MLRDEKKQNLSDFPETHHEQRKGQKKMYSNMTVIALLSGVIIPLLVGLLTKLNASSGVKAIFNFGLSALTAVLATVTDTFEWKALLVNFGLTWAVSVATYYGLWCPTGVAPAVQEATPDFGIG